MSKWTRGSKRKRRKGSSKVSAKIVKIGTVEERSEAPDPTGKRKTVRVGVAGEQTGLGG